MTEAAIVFLGELARRRPEAETSASSASAELDRAIHEAHQRGATEWHPVVLDIGEYAQHLAFAVSTAPGGPADPRAALGSLRTSDLYLARAAGRGDPIAQELFVQRFLVPIARSTASVDASPAMIDDVGQALHERLLLAGDGETPRILQYAGRALLSSWVGVAARRLTLGVLRQNNAHRSAVKRAAEEVLPLQLDPELQLIKDCYRAAFKDAVSSAIARLPQRERTIIRLHTVGGMTLARIGRLLEVDESTASRWEKRARQMILEDTHRELGERLGLRVAEFPSLVRLVTSQLDVSVARLLAGDEDASATP
jgi:RNA polymerase sigma-70 factor (ECF subfamily)